MQIEALLNTNQVAKIVALSPRTLEKMRLSGDGPRFLQLGGRRAVRYRPSDVAAWLESRVRKSTSDSGQVVA